MLQELAAETGATAWAIASMFFFLAVWVGIVVWLFRARAEDFEARARLALEGDGDPGSEDPGLRSAFRRASVPVVADVANARRAGFPGAAADANARRSAGPPGPA